MRVFMGELKLQNMPVQLRNIILTHGSWRVKTKMTTRAVNSLTDSWRIVWFGAAPKIL